jgi:hypothetical protein
MTVPSGAVFLPLIGAVLHPLLGWCIQKGTAHGVRLSVIVAIANLVTALTFLSYFHPTGGWAISGRDWWAIGNGVFFFFGTMVFHPIREDGRSRGSFFSFGDEGGNRGFLFDVGGA